MRWLWVFVVGAINATTACASPVWRAESPLPEPRWFHRSGAIGQTLYVAGGRVSVPEWGSADSADHHGLRLFDPERGSWSDSSVPPAYQYTIRSPSSQRGIPASAKPEGEYAPVAGLQTGQVYWFTIVGPLIFDIRHNSWSQREVPERVGNSAVFNPPVQPFVHRSAAIKTGPDGRIYQVAGIGFPQRRSREKNLSGRVDVYDPPTGGWYELPPLKTPRQRHAISFGLDGKIYVFGGCRCYLSYGKHLEERIPASEARRSLRSVEMFDPATEEWTEVAPMPTPRQMLDAVTVPSGRIYVIGGSKAIGESLNVVEIYDPASDTWSPGPPLRTARHGHAAAVSGHTIYVTGGVHASDSVLKALVGEKEPESLRSVEALTLESSP